jgi:peptide/nickel transport system permease protein
MRNFILFRFALLVPVVLVATILIFAIVQAAPGDPAQAVAGRFASQAEVDILAEQLGFRDHVVKQYVRWLGNAVRGDLGISLEEKAPVFPILMDTFLNTLILGAASGFLAVVLGVSLGVISALKQNTIIDRFILFISLFGLSMPAYWLGLVFIFLFVVKVHWFPANGMYSILGGGGLVDLFKHLALPSLAGCTIAAGIIARVTRSAMLEVLGQDFMTGLRAKGLSEWAVWRHAFRNALPPITTMIGLQLAYILLGSQIFIEIIFTWPGIGLQTFTAAFNRDIPMLQGIVVLSTVVFVLINLLVDVIYLLLNPRVRPV